MVNVTLHLKICGLFSHIVWYWFLQNSTVIREQTLYNFNTFRLWHFCTLFYVPGCIPVSPGLSSMRGWIKFVSYWCVKMVCCAMLSCSAVSDFAAPGTITCQAPLSMGFSRQEYWSELPCLPPGFPTQGSNPGLLHCMQILYHLSHQASLWKLYKS